MALAWALFSTSFFKSIQVVPSSLGSGDLDAHLLFFLLLSSLKFSDAKVYEP